MVDIENKGQLLDGGKDDKALTQSERDSENIENLIGNIPEEDRNFALSVMRMSIENVSPQLELSKKMTSEHITEFLEGQREASNNDYKERHEIRLIGVILVIVAMVFVVTIIVILKNNPDVMKEVLAAIIGLVTGALGGYGYARQKDQ